MSWITGEGIHNNYETRKIFIRGLEDVYSSQDSPRSAGSESTPENFKKDYEKDQSLPCCEGSENCKPDSRKEFKVPYIVTETYDDIGDDDVDNVTDSASVSTEAPLDGIETYNFIISPCISKPHRYKTKVSESVFFCFLQLAVKNIETREA